MKLLSSFFVLFAICLSNNAMDRKQVFYHILAREIRYDNTIDRVQRNQKQVYSANILIDGKFRLMRARFLPNGQIDDSFGDYGVQKGPVCG